MTLAGMRMSDEQLAEYFETERPRLRSIAYRILGTPDDADDVVQDSWLRFSTADDASIENPAAWLTTVASRLAIDRLRSARHRRETYVGPWLADPIASEPDTVGAPDDALILAESLSLGFLAVFKRLTPLERAVFILHDVFAYPLAEVADIIERSPSATRQLAKRARDHIEQGRPRFAPDPDDIVTLTQVVMAAAMNGDVKTLESFLAEDIVHLSDSGPNHHAARRPVVGVDRVGRFFIGLAKRFEPGLEVHIVRANGQVATYFTLHGDPYMLVVANWVDARMTASFMVRKPEKLTAFHGEWVTSR